MNPLTLEWIEKAEGDFATASREIRVRVRPNFDAVCFHAQQMAEKYLKAVLQESGLQIPKTHSLADVLGMCVKLEPTYQLLQADLNILEGFAAEFRYPGLNADKSSAKQAHQAAQAVRKFIRQRLEINQ